VAKRTRPTRSRTAVRHRAATSAAGAVSTSVATPTAPTRMEPAPTSAASATTKITMTDYGYVAGELRRIAILTAIIVALLLALWMVVG
jgi:hypothetical protein